MRIPVTIKAILAVTLCLGVVSCHGNDVARIEVARRHIVLYGHAPFALPVRVIDRAGMVVSPLDVAVRVSPGAVAHLLPPNEVECDRAGTANVEVQAGALKERLDVQCRPDAVMRVLPSAERVVGDSPSQLKFEVEVSVGDAPRPLTFEASFPSGVREVVRPLHVGVMDSQVVNVRADSLIAVAPGRRLLDVELPGQWVFVSVSVSAVQVNDTLALKAGQFRSWALEAGRYTLTVAEVTRRDDLRWLDMVTDGLRCVRDLRAEDTIHCVVYERGTVVVRNLGADQGSPAERASVRIVRRP
jgi:hypothetical protein